jgi:hypothetical protein
MGCSASAQREKRIAVTLLGATAPRHHKTQVISMEE